MSTFDTLNSSIQDSRPIEIYTFTIGTEIYHHTSADETITVNGTQFTPLAGLSRGANRIDRDQREERFQINVPFASPIGAQYVPFLPAASTNVEVEQLQFEDAVLTPVLIFQGRVFSASINDEEIVELQCLSFIIGRARNIPNITYSTQCNFFLGDAGCKVDLTDFTFTAVVQDLVASNLLRLQFDVDQTVPADDDFFLNGVIRIISTGDFRTVSAVTVGLYRLSVPFGEEIIGEAVEIIAGCNHSADPINGHCVTKFNNVINFGGFPFVPVRNPFTNPLV